MPQHSSGESVNYLQIIKRQKHIINELFSNETEHVLMWYSHVIALGSSPDLSYSLTSDSYNHNLSVLDVL